MIENLLNTEDYGSAIKQQRLVIFGIHKNLILSDCQSELSTFIQTQFESMRKTKTVKQVLFGLGDQSTGQHDCVIGSTGSIEYDKSARTIKRVLVGHGRLTRGHALCQTLLSGGGNRQPIIYPPEIYGEDTQTVATWEQQLETTIQVEKGKRSPFPSIPAGLRRLDVMEMMTLTGLSMPFIRNFLHFEMGLVKRIKKISNTVPIDFAEACAHVGSEVLKQLSLLCACEAL